MNLPEVFDAAPPTPPCFPDRRQWAMYLLSCQDEVKSSDRPFDSGIYRPRFNFCADCSGAHADAMLAVGRCQPSMFRAIPIVPLAPRVTLCMHP